MERVDSALTQRFCQARPLRRRATAAWWAVPALALAACSAEAPPAPSAPTSTTVAASTTAGQPPSSAPAVTWRVGARPLPRRPDGFGQIEPTPPELVNRALPTKDFLPPPAGAGYASTISVVPADVLARSTWQPACPVKAGDLRSLTMSFWGFDGRAHTGEMLVNARGAADGQPTWSAHASGLAVDVNPFCNPYTRGDLVLPELASAYVDRSRKRPGMVLAGDATVRAFAAIGWRWGGNWRSPTDRMHFTATGR
nr:M15 family metallopeptidase [Amycolatopsis sp. MtRt-6]